MLRGHAWVMLDDRPPVLVSTGDVAIRCGTDPYTVADDPATAPQFVIHNGGYYTDVDGVDVTNEAKLGLRTCGHGMDASVVLVSGTYQVGGDVGGRLLNALPPVLVVPERDARGPVMDMVMAAVTKDDPGQQVVLDRLLDLALITTLRAWFARPEAQAPGWYRAQSDASSALPCGCCTTARPTRGRWPAWPPRRERHERRSPAGSPSSSASPR